MARSIKISPRTYASFTPEEKRALPFLVERNDLITIKKFFKDVRFHFGDRDYSILNHTFKVEVDGRTYAWSGEDTRGFLDITDPVGPEGFPRHHVMEMDQKLTKRKAFW